MEKTHYGEFIAERLRKSATELEKFDLQVNLGKMEALEAYERMRKKYAAFLHETKHDIEKQRDQLLHFLNKIEDLRVQIDLGKAETYEVFIAKKKQINLAIHELEVAIKTNPEFIKRSTQLLEMVEQLKIKLDILSQRSQPARERLKSFYAQRKIAVEKLVQSVRQAKPQPKQSKWVHFQQEMSQAYNHLKKAFVS